MAIYKTVFTPVNEKPWCASYSCNGEQRIELNRQFSFMLHDADAITQYLRVKKDGLHVWVQTCKVVLRLST